MLSRGAAQQCPLFCGHREVVDSAFTHPTNAFVGFDGDDVLIVHGQADG